MMEADKPGDVFCVSGYAMMARGETKPGATPQELAVDSGAMIDELMMRGMPIEAKFEVEP